MTDIIESALADIRPMLAAAGRSIRIKEATENSCVIELAGFCGDCNCTQSYMEGIQELLNEKAPQITNIQFISA